MPLVREVELVVGKEDRDLAHASLPSPVHGRLDLVENGVHLSARVLPAEVGRGAVDALHGTADPRPHRERVRRRVQRVAERRPAEPEVVGADPLLFASPDEAWDAVERLALADPCERLLTRADDAVLDVEVLEALLRAGGEAGAADEEGRLRRGLAESRAQREHLREQEADV